MPQIKGKIPFLKAKNVEKYLHFYTRYNGIIILAD